MHFIAAFLAPALSLAPADAGEMPFAPVVTEAAAHTGEVPMESKPRHAPGWMAAEAWRAEREAKQVRIRQEIMIRVSPRRPNTQELVADWRRVLPQRFHQRKIGNCLPARNIVAVQTMSSRDLVLHLSDKRMIRAQLPKSCNARDYYLGFYLEPTEDGELCVGRDTLKARNGATCKIGGIRELVPAE